MHPRRQGFGAWPDLSVKAWRGGRGVVVWRGLGGGGGEGRVGVGVGGGA